MSATQTLHDLPVRSPVSGRLAGRCLAWLAQKQEYALVLIVIATVIMMIMPVPPMVADLLITLNISIALLLLMLALYIRASVQFSTLPSVILITTAFRLSISITTSRLVLTQGYAGDIINAFGSFVIGGNIVVGLVIYLIITIVQFVVITKGAERVAEVAARFTLDALPGKQISIDTDLRNGDIDKDEARQRRDTLQRESQLYGAMDGAMKFVKGDAIASLVIILVNLIGGMIIGCLQRGLSFQDSVNTYSRLAVGDGLVAQIPALLISLTAGITVTRVTSDAARSLGHDIVAQVISEPRTLQIGGALLFGLALLPGFPSLVFIGLGTVMTGGGWFLGASRRRADAAAFDAAKLKVKHQAEAAVIQVRLGQALMPAIGEFEAAAARVREAVAGALGVPIPRIIAAADGMTADGFAILIDDVRCAATAPETAHETAHETVFPEALRGVLLRHVEQFIGIQETQALLAPFEASHPDLVREATKACPLPKLAEVLRRLVAEQVSIRHMRPVLEAIAEWGPREQSPSYLVEYVRLRLREQICAAYQSEGELRVLLLDGETEEWLRQSQQNRMMGAVLAPDEIECQRVIAAMRRMLAEAGAGGPPVVLMPSDLRPMARRLLLRQQLDCPVLSTEELAPGLRLRTVGVVRDIDRQAAAA